jgi:hypothetical protein
MNGAATCVDRARDLAYRRATTKGRSGGAFAGPSDGAASDGAASDGAASDGSAQRADQSGNGRDLANGTSATQPELPTGDVAFGGRRSMRFSYLPASNPQAVGGSEVLRSVAPAKPIGAPSTAYFVYRGGDPAVTGGLFLFESGTAAGNDFQELRINSASTTWNFSWVTQLSGGSAVGLPVDLIPNATVSSGHLLILVLDSSSAAYLDHHATANTTSVTLPNATMGDFNLGATMLAQNGLNGAIAEVMVYSGAHGPTERKNVADYVSSRYGLTIPP